MTVNFATEGDQPNNTWGCWPEIHRLRMQTEGQRNAPLRQYFDVLPRNGENNIFNADKPTCVPSERVEC